MKKSSFNYGWVTRRKFAAERRRQLKWEITRYSEEIDKGTNSYWKVTSSVPEIDIDQDRILSDFCKSFLTKKKDSA